jgi:hypothetical protein
VDGKSRRVASGWFDVEALARVEPKILADLHAGRPVSLSTGLVLSAEPAPPGSVHNGRPYGHIARDFKPDHLAVFADQPGACSLADGCGVLVVGNALSHRTLHERLARLLQERFAPAYRPDDPDASPPPPWLLDVFDSYVVFADKGDTFRLGYRTDLRTDAVTLSEEQPVEVTLQTSYRPVSNSTPDPDPEPEEQPMPLTQDQRRETVALLVANCQGAPNVPWRGMTPQAVEALDDATLAAYGQWQRSLTSNAPQPQQPAPQAQPQPVGVMFTDGTLRRQDASGAWVAVQQPAPAPAPQPVSNAPQPQQQPAPRVKTAEEWAAETFPGLSFKEVDGAVRHVLEIQRQHKAGLVERFTSNLAVGEERDRVAEQLNLLPAESLERLLPLAEQRRPVANYSGAAGAPLSSGRHERPEPLLAPAFNGGGPNWR